jgi:saccharopine dehydrogenase-like NADP-dependent oxidoreductase
MQRVLVLGAGKIGSLVAGMLTDSGDFEVLLADRDAATAESVANAHWPRQVQSLALDAMDTAAVARCLTQRGCVAVVCCLPYFANPPVAAAAREAGVHYFDLTEDVTSTRAVRAAADGAKSAFVPQAGLAPGFISIAAAELMRRFDEIDTVRLRVGALPAHPNNALKYNLTWSTDGLINEYANPCLAVEDGREVELRPLDGLESLILDGVEYEAFNTSGGLGSLGESFAGRARSMNYKTLRYPGHCVMARLLMQDLRLADDRDTLKRILERAVPQTDDDVVIVYVSVSGRRDGVLHEDTFVRHVYPATIAGREWTAIQITTAAGACAVIDLVLGTPDQYHGFVRQEDFTLGAVLNNRFGRHYDLEKHR